jgi:hypothetical protein
MEPKDVRGMGPQSESIHITSPSNNCTLENKQKRTSVSSCWLRKKNQTLTLYPLKRSWGYRGKASVGILDLHCFVTLALGNHFKHKCFLGPFHLGTHSDMAPKRRVVDNSVAKRFPEIRNAINLGKKSESDRALTTELSQALANGMLGGNKTVQVADSGDTHGAGSASSGGEFTDTIHNLMGSSPSAQPTGKYGTPAMLDWKQRSADICQQISKRGMSPYDFGCLQDPDDVEVNFSYRGYAKMVCSRLGTVYDPGVPEMCGCPPATWPGWRP